MKYPTHKNERILPGRGEGSVKGLALSQEGLKLIACLSMLADHIGYLLVPGIWLRIIGRLAFPIYCFLLAEGTYRTKNPPKYMGRLLLTACLSELPFDLMLRGGIHWNNQNVMFTLLLGFMALQLVLRSRFSPVSLCGAAALALLAEWMGADYGMEGVLVVLLFGMTRDLPYKFPVQALGMVAIFAGMGGATLFTLGNRAVSIQVLGALAIVPISLYSGQKRTFRPAVRWAFYLFYPIHMLALYLIALM